MTPTQSQRDMLLVEYFLAPGGDLSVVLYYGQGNKIRTFNSHCYRPDGTPELRDALALQHVNAAERSHGKAELFIAMSSGVFRSPIAAHGRLQSMRHETWLGIRPATTSQHSRIVLIGRLENGQPWELVTQPGGVKITYPSQFEIGAGGLSVARNYPLVGGSLQPEELVRLYDCTSGAPWQQAAVTARTR